MPTNGWGNIYCNSFSGDTALASGGGGGFDPDYQAVLDYATTQGYTLPSAGQQVLQNQLVVDLKAAGVWGKLDSFAVFATDGDADYALVDWIRLATMTKFNAPIFTANQGYTGDATSAYINTGTTLEFVGSNFNSTTSIGSFGGWSFNVKGSGGNVLCGSTAAVNTIRGGTGDYIMGSLAATPITPAGLYHINSNGTQSNQFINGASVSTGTASNIFDPFNFSALRDSLGFSVDTISVMFSGGNLGDEAPDLYTSIQTYISSL